MKLNNKRGFSLIELMVVIAIIGILATAGITQYASYQARARDTVRMQDLSGFQTALATFQADNGKYPKTRDNKCLVDEDIQIDTETKKFGVWVSSKIPLDPSKNNKSKPCDTNGLYGYKLLEGPTGIPDSAFLLTAHVENPKNANMNADKVDSNYNDINAEMSLDGKAAAQVTARAGEKAIYAKLN